MGNALTRAGQGLTLAEKRIVGCAVSKLDSRKAIAPGTVPTTKITAAEYAETFGVDIDTAYNRLESAEKHLDIRLIPLYE
ncbi:RepB family plasmid replication initiator protein, partial [Pseudomonas helleri]|nr:RepB family plasmid replication initiator protein [Pseudomonas helleri]